MPYVAGHESSPRRTCKWGIATLGFLAAASLGILVIRTHARESRGAESPWSAAFATDDAAIPDDTVLREQLEKAIDLRRRESSLTAAIRVYIVNFYRAAAVVSGQIPARSSRFRM